MQEIFSILYIINIVKKIRKQSKHYLTHTFTLFLTFLDEK